MNPRVAGPPEAGEVPEVTAQTLKGGQLTNTHNAHPHKEHHPA
jgi:hypothetical protein